MKPTVLICDYVDHLLLNGLADLGFRPVYAPEVANDQVADWLPGMVGIVVNTRTPVRKPLMDKCPDLRFIGRLGAGLDIFDVDEAERRGIAIVNTPGANANAVGEHMFGMLLALMRHIPVADASVRRGAWLRERHRGRELKGLTIGVIGFGNTGSAFAHKFANWETKVVAYDKYKTHYAEDLRFVEESSLSDVMSRSDVISLHVPLTNETRDMVNLEFLQQCKPGVVILNGSRGEVVVTKDLITCLENGIVSGAGLDVLENEKIGALSHDERDWYDALCSRKNVVMTPHIAGWTHASKANIARQMIEGIRDVTRDIQK